MASGLRNIKTACLVALVAASTSGGFASAQNSPPRVGTGNELFAACGAENDVASFWSCMGFLRGTMETHDLFILLNEQPRFYCTPKTVTNGQVRDVVLDGLRRNPADRHYPSVVLTLRYLKEAFPCPNPS